MVKFMKAQQNSDNQDAPPGRIQPIAKQLKTKPRNWVTLMPPGGTFMPARRFLGRFPEFFENNTFQQGISGNSIHINTLQ